MATAIFEVCWKNGTSGLLGHFVSDDLAKNYDGDDVASHLLTDAPIGVTDVKFCFIARKMVTDFGYDGPEDAERAMRLLLPPWEERELSSGPTPADEGIAAARLDAAMLEACRILNVEYGRDASVEHPGYILVEPLRFGTVNPPTWGWDTEEGEGGSMEVSSLSQDGREIAAAIEKVIASRFSQRTPR